MKTQALEQSEINYEVLNALNLQHPQLGEIYLKFQWNPLGENFKLDLPYIEKYLEKTKDKREINSPAFLNQKHTQAKEAFKLALKNNSELLNALQNQYDNGEYNLYKNVDISKEVNDIIFFLKCRGKMLEVAIGQFKGNKTSTFEAYKNITSINKALSALLEEAYTIQFNRELVIQNFIHECELEEKRKREQAALNSGFSVVSNLQKQSVKKQEPKKQLRNNLFGKNIGGLVKSLAEIAGAFVGNIAKQHTEVTNITNISNIGNDLSL